MRRGWTMALAMVLAGSMGVSAALAGPPCCASKKQAKDTKVACAEKSACKIGDFPAIQMMVGKEAYHCPMTAEKIAKEAGSKIVFVVGEEKFDSQEKAIAVLAAAAEKYVGRYTKIGCIVDGKLVYCDEKAEGSCSASCSMQEKKASAGGGCCASKAKGASVKDASAKGGCSSTSGSKAKKASGAESGGEKPKTVTMVKAGGKAGCDKSKCEKCKVFFVLGRQFDSYEAAEKARDEARAATKKVKMTYIVNGEKVDCAEKVCPKAKAAGEVQFVVNDEKTGCELTARVSLARAQYEAAKTVGEKLTKL